ncbi:4-amino-4-deoxy-L-arabinose transferase [Formivibrio citricus]|uniref:4-amino-4-deoxy-L-arabinose transferase n=1 Tax=Formivibrio citricus TaxID=83765 RepID=A0A1I5D8A7_9NEIS|nr:glycosyltransferase family 39 protein [Formivibrio citricus]SFN95442.1 4-amino-4-deoxy-L-arabinose transferase [Formivibrio citricus]
MTPRADQQLPFWVFLAVLLCWLLPGLVGHEPWKPDEGYTFGLVRHIAATGDWVVPTLAGEPFMEKPPLYFIVAAGFLKLLGGILNPPDAARLASGFFLVLALVAVAGAARELHGRGCGRWAALALIGCVGLAVRAHQMITDTALLAGTAWGLYGYALGLRRPVAGGIALGLGAATAFLSKGLLGPGLLGVAGLVLPLLGRAFRDRRYAGFLLVALLAFLPLPALWMSALYERSPELFRVWFWVNNLGRFDGTAGLGPRADHHFFYLLLLPWYALPALPLAAVALWRERARLLAAVWKVPLAYFLTALLVLSAASDARELYALPLLPPLAILAAGAVRFHMPPSLAWRRLWLACFGLLAFAIWLAGIALAFGVPQGLWLRLMAKAPGLQPHGSIGLLLLALVVTALLAALSLGRRAWQRGLFVWTAGFSLCWALAMLLGMPFLDYTKRYAETFRALSPYLPQGECVASLRLGEPQRALLDYYAGLRTLRSEVEPRAATCRYTLVQRETGQGEVKLNGRLLWKGGRPGDSKEWYEFYELK